MSNPTRRQLSLVLVWTLLIGLFGGTQATPAFASSASFLDTFDGETVGLRTTGGGWYIDSTYGSVAVAALSDDDTNKGLRLTDDDYDAAVPYRTAAQAERRFTNQTGTVAFETKLRIEPLNDEREHLNVIFYNASQQKVAGIYYSFGHIGYFDSSGNQTNIPDAAYLGEWITVRFQFDLAAAKYDLTIASDALNGYAGSDTRVNKTSGTFVARNLPTISSMTSIDRVKFLPQDKTGVYDIDYLTMDDEKPVWTSGMLSVQHQTSTKVTLGWNAAADNLGVARYTVYEGSYALASVAATELTATVQGLTPGPHQFFVEAEDIAGNVADFKPSVSTTLVVDSFRDTFDAEAAGPRASGAGWYIDSTYGVAEVVYDPLSDNAANKSLLLTDDDYDPGNPYRIAPLAERRFTNQTGPVSFETSIRIEPLRDNREHFNVIFYNASQMKVAGIYYSYGHLGYFDASGNQTNIPDAPYLGKWITLRFTFDLANAGYDLTVISDALHSYTGSDARIDKTAGTFTEHGLPTIAGRTSIDRVKYLPQDMTGKYWINELTMDNDAPAWNSGTLTLSGKTATTATLSWNAATDDLAIARYTVYEGVYALGTVPGSASSITLTGLSPSAHTFTIEAEDYAGNKASNKPAVTVSLAVTSFRDTFDDEPVGPRVTGSGWYFDSAYGTSAIAATPGDEASGSKSLVLFDNDNESGLPYRYAASAERRFAAQTGNVTFESRLRISAADTELQHFNMIFYNTAQQKVAGIYYSYGHIGYFDASGNQINIPDAAYLGKWITVRFTFDLAAASYDLTVISDALTTYGGTDPGVDTATGTYVKHLPTIAGKTSIDRVKYLPQSFTGVYTIDYLLMDNDSPVWNGGSLTVAGAGSSTIDLRWNGAADDYEIAHYNIYADGVLVQSAPGNASGAMVYNLTTGPHTFVVEAEDYAGHRTTNNPSVNATLVVNSFYNSFDGEPIGPRVTGAGWYIDSTYGVVDVVYDPTATDPLNRSLRLTDNDYDAGNPYRTAASAERRFVNQTGYAAFETSIRVEPLNHSREHFNVIFYNASQQKVAGVYYSFGHLGYFDASGNQINIPDAAYLGKWITLRFTFDLAAAHYDLTIVSDALKGYAGSDPRIDKSAGTFTERGLPTIAGRTTVDRVKYLPQDVTGTYYIDDFTMDNGLPIWNDGSMEISTKRLGSVTLTWQGAIDDRGVIGGYRLYEGTTPVGAVYGDTARITLQHQSIGAHTYRVEAVDALGNESFGGPQLKVDILAPSTGVPVPPNEHPRLLIRSRDIPALQAKATDPAMQAVWSRVLHRAQTDQDGYLPPITAPVYTNFNSAVLESIEAKALLYLIQDDEEMGQEAIAMIGHYIDSLQFDPIYDAYFKSKYAGQVMMAASIVYDWCYALLGDQEKQALRNRILSLTRFLEYGFPMAIRSYVGGHDNEANTFEDVLSFGVAVFDEKDDVYLTIADELVNDFAPVRNFLLASETYYQGDSYSQPKLSYELMTNLIFSGMGADKILPPEESKAAYTYLYARRPDGQLLRDGDSYMSSSQAKGSYWFYPDLFLFGAGQYQDPFLQGEYERQYAIAPSVVDPVKAFLFQDQALQSKPVSELPLTKYFGSPYGSMIARTGWGTEPGVSDVIAEMKVKEYQFNNHSHLDSGAFQIYYKGALAIDSGIYNGVDSNQRLTAYGGSHDINYHKRTIAHNAMLIYDPDEQFDYYGRVVANDGGQKWIHGSAIAKNLEQLQSDYKVADVVGHAVGAGELRPDFSYLKGDLTAAYAGKAELYTRSFVFLNLQDNRHPAAMLVYDKVKATDPSNKKYWLLHSSEEPVVSGNTTTIVTSGAGDNGKLVNTALLPAPGNATTEVIGGAGHEFDVFGTNYPVWPQSTSTSDEPGAWRIQISPNTPQADDSFLNVLQVMDNVDGPEPLVPTAIDADNMVGAKIADRVVMFGKGETKLSGTVTFQVYGDEDQLHYLITDLAAGYWTVERDGQRIATQIEVAEGGGVLDFVGSTGKFVLTRSAVRTYPTELTPVWTAAAAISASHISATGATLSWNGATAGAAPIAAYRIYESGRQLAEVSGVTESTYVSGLAPGYHTFRIEAVDAAGLVSNTGPSTTVDLETRYTVSGTVYQYGSGPLMGATVTIKKQVDGIVAGVAVAASDGRFILPDLVAGDYVMETKHSSTSTDTRQLSIPADDLTQDVTLLPQLAIAAVVASMEPEGVATNTIDGSVVDGSTWQGHGDGVWIQYDFGANMFVSRADIAWYQSPKQRITYDIAVSTDGITFTNVFSGQSALAPAGFQTTLFDPVSARYVRIIGHGNSGSFSTWTSINEVAFYYQPS